MEKEKNKYAPQERYAKKLKERTMTYQIRLYTDQDLDIIQFLTTYPGQTSKWLKSAIRKAMKEEKK